MKKHYGKTLNISIPILGKITRKPVWIDRKNFILITDNQRLPSGYSAFITQYAPKEQVNSPVLYDMDCIEQLEDGDIVSIEPDGKVNVLYEISSPHNTLMITQRCNYSCIMCPQPKIAKEEDRTQHNLKLISLMSKQTRSLGITGGEPTLVGDNLIDIISACKKNLPNTSLTLLTNGVRFADKEYARKISQLGHHDLLIDIPLYSDTDTKYEEIVGAHGFYKTIEGLYNLALLEQKVGIRIVIHKMTYQRLPQLAEFIYRNFPFVFHVAFMQMETIGLAKENIERLWIDPYDYNAELEKAVMYLSQREMNVSIYNAQLCVLPRKLWRFARKSISLWKRIYIEECDKCDSRNDCGGFFASSGEKHSQYIHAMKNA